MAGERQVVMVITAMGPLCRGQRDAPVVVPRAVVPHRLQAAGGQIVTTTSHGTMLREGYVVYGASKAAAEAATAVMSADLAGSRVTGMRCCRAVSPTRGSPGRSCRVSNALTHHVAAAPGSPLSRTAQVCPGI